MDQLFMRLLLYVWASPGSVIGLIAAILSWCTGGSCRIHTGVLEVSGGFARWVLRNLVLPKGGASAMTLGHVVIAVSRDALNSTRSHERVHVRQYERWGPMFIPAYLACSIWCAIRGRDVYFENPFEKEAFEKEAYAKESA